MYCVSVKDNHYNELAFYFESLAAAEILVEMSVKEGYEVKIKLAHEEEMLPV